MNTLDELTLASVTLDGLALAVSHHWQIHLLSVTLDEYHG